MQEHKIKFGSKEIEIKEPDGAQAAVFLANSRSATQASDFDEVEKVTNWIVGKCTDLSKYKKLKPIEQARVVSIILSIATGTYDAPKPS